MGYTAIQAARLSGCSAAQLDVWRRIGLVVPDDADPAGRTRSVTSSRCAWSRSLLDAGLPMRRIRRAVAELAAHR